MKKRIFSIITCLALCLSLLPTAVMAYSTFHSAALYNGEEKLDNNTVTVDGVHDQTITIKVLDTAEKDITGNLVWSVSGSNDVIVNQIADAPVTLTVNAKAAEGSVTITGIADGTLTLDLPDQSGQAVEIPLTIKRTSEPTLTAHGALFADGFWDDKGIQDTTYTYGQTYGEIFGHILDLDSAMIATTGEAEEVEGEFEINQPLNDRPGYNGGNAHTVTVTFKPNPDSIVDGEDITQMTFTKDFTFTVAKRDITISLKPGEYYYSKVYDGTADVSGDFNTGIFVLNGVVVGDDVAVNGTTHAASLTGSDAGDYQLGLTNINLTGEDVGNYNVTAKPESAPARITKATIHSIEYVADGTFEDLEMYADDSKNTLANMTTVVRPANENPLGLDFTGSIGVDLGTHTLNGLPVTWTAPAEATYNPKGGTYTFTGTLAGDELRKNFANPDAVNITVQVTVKPVTATQITIGSSENTVTKSNAKAAEELLDLGIYTRFSITTDFAGTPNYDAVWNKTLEQVQAEAETVTTEKTIPISLDIARCNLPQWLTIPDGITVPVFKLTVTSKNNVATIHWIEGKEPMDANGAYNGAPVNAVEIGVSVPEDITADNGVITYRYTGNGYDSATPPTNAGTYTVAATYEGEQYYGIITDEFTITPKELTVSWDDDDVTVIYTGSTTAMVPQPTLDGIVGQDADSVKAVLLYEGTEANGTAYGPSSTVPTNAGAYAVTADLTGEAAGNYKLADNPAASLTIEKAERWIFTGTGSNVVILLPNAPSATLSWELLPNANEAEVSFESCDSAAVTVNGSGVVTARGTGFSIITMNVAESKNYKAAKTSFQVISVLHPLEGVSVTPSTLTATLSGDTICISGVARGIDGLDDIACTYNWAQIVVDTFGAGQEYGSGDFGDSQVMQVSNTGEGVTVLTGVSITLTPNGMEPYTFEYSIDTSGVIFLPDDVNISVVGTTANTYLRNIDNLAQAIPQSFVDQLPVDPGNAIDVTITIDASAAGDTVTIGGVTYSVVPAGGGAAIVPEGTPYTWGFTKPIDLCIESVGDTYVLRSDGVYLKTDYQGVLNTVDFLGTFTKTNLTNADVTFHFADGTVKIITYTPNDIGQKLPTDSLSGKIFLGWVDGDPEGVTDPTYAAGYAITAENLNYTGGETYLHNVPLNSIFKTPAPSTPTGGSSSGSSSDDTPSTPPTQSVTVPVGGEESSMEVGATVKGDTATVDKVDMSKLDTIVGSDSGITTVTIDFSGVDSKESITNVELPADVIKEIAAAVNDPSNDAQSLEIVFSNGASIELDAAVLNEKISQADGENISISIESHEDVALTTEQKNAVGDRPAFEITMTSGGKPIRDMGGKITLHAPYQLRPGENPRGLVVWYVDDNGKKERYQTSYDPATGRVSWKTDHLSLYMIGYDETQANNPFTDVTEDNYYFDAVLWALDEGITGGTSATTFSPDASCTRAQMATFLWRAAGSPEPKSNANPFADVDEGAYYAKAVQWAYEQGITGGTSATTFSPDASCTRAQMATFIYRNEQAKGGGFTGAWMFRVPFTDAPEWAFEAIAWCYMKGVTSGTSETTFSPDADCTRGQMATFLYRYFERK